MTDPENLRAALGGGLACFAVTHAREDFGFAEEDYREHVAALSALPVAAVFAATGTGEFPALTPAEVARVVRAAVAASDRPVIAPAGYGTAHAVTMARDAEEAGAAGVFLLPAYLATLPPEALPAHLHAVCAATGLDVLVDHRLRWLAADCPNLVGLEPDAGAALPSIVNFAPHFALDLHAALAADETETVRRMVDDFVLPYLDIRGRRAGYAVAVVKAALTAVGRPAGPVRPPLTDLTTAEFGELAALLDKVEVR